jgi:ligand-binding sensor domain-containing protein/serine phosphatase RsbU (regulator of sigma subunit)
MRILLLFVIFFTVLLYSAVGQVYEIEHDSIQICIPGKNGLKDAAVKKLGSPYLLDFKGLKRIVPGVTKQTLSPFSQTIIGDPIVNNGLNKVVPPDEIKLKYEQTKNDSNNTQKGIVNRIAIKLPTVVEAGTPAYKEGATINLQYLDIAQGLFSSYIMAIEIDKYGTIWIGTYDAGLIAYDGRSFYQYNTDQGLPSNQILSLLIDKNNQIWIGTLNNGLICFNGSDFQHYTSHTGLPGNKVRTIKQDTNGRIWLGTDNGLAVIHDSTLLVYGKDQGLDVRQIYDIAIGPNNELWLGTFNMGLIMYDGISFFQYSMMHGLETSAIWAVNTDSIGNVWMGTFGEGIIKYDGTKFSQFTTSQGITTTEFYSVKRDRKNNLWFGTDGGGVIKYDGKEFTQINSSHGLTNDIINDIFEDPAGNYWFASHGGGLMAYDGGNTQYLSEEQGLVNNIALCFNEDQKNNMWIGSWGKGIMKYDGNSIESWNQSNGLNDNTIWDIEFDINNNLWFGSENGVSRIQDNILVTYNTHNGLTHSEVTALTQDDKGMWVGTYQGLNFVRNDSIIRYGEKQGLHVNEIKKVFKDRYGSIWIGSSDNGLAVFVHNKFFHINIEHGLSSNIIYDIFEDSSGNIWIATNDKLNIIPSEIGKNIFKILARPAYKELSIDLYHQLKNNIKKIGKNEGLKSNLIRSIISINDKDLWIGTGNGISKISEYPEFTNNIPLLNIFGTYYQIENFGYIHGFIGGDVFSNNSVGSDHHKNIWWGTGKLVTIMNQRNNIDSLKPEVQITGISLFYENMNWLEKNSNTPADQLYRKIDFGKKPIIRYDGISPWNYLPKGLELSHEVNHITFNFTGVDWANPMELKYKFMLEGYDESYNPATKLHKSTYSNLEPGKYIFRVIATNKTSVQSNLASFEFTILPPWWKTIWFRVIAIAVILVIIYIVYQWRIASYKHRQKELENLVTERTSEVTEKNEELMQQTEEILAQRNEIESQKDQLEKVHQDLMESIEYSHFIQTSMMPNSQIIPGLTEQFILFKPKERISGDFYWWTANSDKIIATVADCTGHGVPGALMSMLGISFLREIIIKENVEEPSLILNKLRQEIIAVLDQKMEKGVQKDGMDMALIFIDLKRQILKFAGARNTLVLVRNGQVFEYTSDRAPISIYLKMKDFSQQEIQLQSGDQLYLFSDGYPDQFNGENGKKYKRSRFKELLLSISHKPMSEQKLDLMNHFEKWKGNEEQIDDVTIVGFKI